MDDRLRSSRKQEKDGAEKFGGRVNSRSGAGELFKGDVRTDDELIEFKTTRAVSYRLKIADLIKAWRQATLDGRKMVFGIQFEESDNVEYSAGSPTAYVIQTEHDYLTMRRETADLQEQVNGLRLPRTENFPLRTRNALELGET